MRDLLSVNGASHIVIFWRLVYKLMQWITINFFATTIQNTYSYKFKAFLITTFVEYQAHSNRQMILTVLEKQLDCSFQKSVLFKELAYNLISDLIAKIISTTSHGTTDFLLTSLKVLLVFGSLTYFNKIVI